MAGALVLVCQNDFLDVVSLSASMFLSMSLTSHVVPGLVCTKIELCLDASSDNLRICQVFTKMLINNLCRMYEPSSETRILTRCDINFYQSAQGWNLNTMIRRAAHVKFLETDI
jgi:hypothetical protein